jgi:hypothetical protein
MNLASTFTYFWPMLAFSIKEYANASIIKGWARSHVRVYLFEVRLKAYGKANPFGLGLKPITWERPCSRLVSYPLLDVLLLKQLKIDFLALSLFHLMVSA